MSESSHQKYAHWIGGKEHEPENAQRIERYSPSSECLISSYIAGSAQDVDLAVHEARRAMNDNTWSDITGKDRAEFLNKTAELIRHHSHELARVETLESGKPISQARDEMEWAAGLWEYAAALCRQLHGEAYNSLGKEHLGFTLKEPIGVVGLITPWNFPLLIISQKLPFALGAGCACVVKPSEYTSGTTLHLARILQEAGLPDGVCNVVTGYGNPAGQRLVEHDGIDMVSFTGSTSVGKKIIASSASTVKKVALELGGKNPQIILPDCDFEAAVDAVVFGLLFNMGECCNSGSRILVHNDLADRFVSRVVEQASKVCVGDPLDESTQVGAIINESQFEKICGYINEGEKSGAKVRLGGSAMEATAGRYIQPTVLDHVTPSMRVASEEIFGPVLSVLRFKDDEEAIEIANEVAYGLSGSVWTANIDRAMRLARQIKAGTVWVNCFMDGFAELPFGGYKGSGLGRELGRNALEEYTETKTLIINHGLRESRWV